MKVNKKKQWTTSEAGERGGVISRRKLTTEESLKMLKIREEKKQLKLQEINKIINQKNERGKIGKKKKN